MTFKWAMGALIICRMTDYVLWPLIFGEKGTLSPIQRHIPATLFNFPQDKSKTTSSLVNSYALLLHPKFQI